MGSDLLLRGSGGANRSMEAEVKRLARRALGQARIPDARRLDPQTLAFPFAPDLAWFAVNYLRTPARVFWHLGATDARRLEPLHDAILTQLDTLPDDWLGNASRLSVEVRRAGDFPAGPLQIRGAAKSAIVEAARRRGGRLTLDPEDPERLFAVEVRDDAVWLSLDLVGRSLHQRGYRRARGEAPLRENVAAQLLMLARWDPRKEALLDPMAGSGTIAIEAASMARASSLWCDGYIPLARTIPAIRPFFDRILDPLFPDASPPILANEIHSDTIRAMRDNLRRASVEQLVQPVHGDFRDLTPDRVANATERAETGLVLVNPPYGQRVEGKGAGDPDIIELYEDLAHWWQSLGRGWRLGILSDHPAVTQIFGRRTMLEKPVSNGPLKAWFRVYQTRNQ